jgi:hypothetical protein
MVLRNFVRTFCVALAGCAGLFALGSGTQAGPYKSCHCSPSRDVFQSPFFGYYPTCWRRWPGGQPVCPPNEPPSTEPSRMPRADEAPAEGGKSPPEEQLPAPKPENGAMKSTGKLTMPKPDK